MSYFIIKLLLYAISFVESKRPPWIIIEISFPNDCFLVYFNFLWYRLLVCLFWEQQLPLGQGLLVYGFSRSHTTTHHSR